MNGNPSALKTKMTLNLSKVSETYFNKLFETKVSPQSTEIKARVLLVDKHTTPIISMSYTQSQLLQNDIVLVEMIENQSNLNVMKHLNCIVYIKPTQESIKNLIKELKSPHFNKYELFTNNTLNKNQLEGLAEADEFEAISQVLEIFQDYLIVNNNLFTINISSGQNTIMEESNSLASLLLSLKKCPIIKYESNSIELKKLSSEILYNINSNSNNNLFEDLNKNSDVPPILLLLDRKNDPITPLILPWTYQSMIHELIGINKNMVELAESEEPIILSESQDPFFKQSMYLNYGDLTDKFQEYVEEYKKQTKQSSIENLKTQNLSELKKVLTRFPEFKKLLNNILKHLNLISELDTQISRQSLWEVSELQQTIICNLENQQVIRTRLLEILDKATISTENKIKLVLIYSVKFSQNDNDLAVFLNKFHDPTITNPVPTVSQMSLMKNFNKQFNKTPTSTNNNNSNNIGKIFNNKKISINLLFNNSTNNSTTNNIYMQYIPKLNELLNELINQSQNHSNQFHLSTLVPDIVTKQYGNVGDSVQDIIIYIKGGITYEESRLIHDLSLSNNKINLIIGSDTILNSERWLNKMYDDINETHTNQTNTADHGLRTKQLRDIL